MAKTAFAPDRERARHRELRLHPKGIGQHVSGRQGAAAARAGPDAARLGSLGLQRPPRTPGALLRAQGHGTARPIHHPQPLFGRKDVGERAGPGFGIRIDPLPLRHGNKKIGRNFEVFTPWDFIAAITQHMPTRASSSCAITGGIPTRCAAGGPSRRTKKCRPRATPWRRSTVALRRMNDWLFDGHRMVLNVSV